MNGLPLERAVPKEVLDTIINDAVVSDEPISMAREYEGAPVLRTATSYRRDYMNRYLSKNIFVLNRGCDIIKWIESIGAANLLREAPQLAIEGKRRCQPFTNNPKTEVWERVVIRIALLDTPDPPFPLDVSGTMTTAITFLPLGGEILVPHSLGDAERQRLVTELGSPVAFGFVELLRTVYKLAFLKNRFDEPDPSPLSVPFTGMMFMPHGVIRHPKEMPEADLNAFVAEIRAKRAAVAKKRRNTRRRNRWP